jgi:AcrR family transcriptional regulator
MTTTATRQPAAARRADGDPAAAILEAGARLLSADPAANVADIARAAGVDEGVLHGRFPSREALVAAVLDRTVRLTDEALADEAIDAAPAPEAMAGLLRSSWEVLDRHRRLFLAADRVLPTERIREHHEAPLRRVERLIARGRHEGDFRTDLPLGWLVTTFFSIIHSAAQEREAGRLGAVEVEPVLVTTMLSLLTTTG